MGSDFKIMRPSEPKMDKMTQKYLDKQKTIEICNEMLEFLKHNDVVYSIRETGTGKNIHVELDHSTGEYPTFTIFKAYPTKKISGNNLLKPPECPEVKKLSIRKSMENGKIIKASSEETLENQNKLELKSPKLMNKLTKSSSMYNMNHSFRKLALKKTDSNETIDCGDLEKERTKKSFISSPLVQRQKSQTRNSFALGSRESMCSLDSIEENDESSLLKTPEDFIDKTRWFSQNVQNGTRKLCRLLTKMKAAKLKNKNNEEVSALDSALQEDIATLAPAIESIEDDVQIQLEKEEEEKRKQEEKRRIKILERKRLERVWRKRAEELYMSKKKERKTLDEMVKEAVLECKCMRLFQITFVSEGRYRMGELQSNIFVRALRNDVWVRVGGGWQMLSELLAKHDPCRTGQNHSADEVSINSLSSDDIDMRSLDSGIE